MLGEVTAVILAGGLGTRLRAVIQDRPKVLAEIAGRPFLSYLFDQLVDAGIRQVVLCTGHLSGQVSAVFGASYGSLRIVYSVERVPLGTAGALRFALHLLRSDPVLVMNGDSYCAATLEQFWRWHCAHEAAASLFLTRVDDTARFGRVQFADSGAVSAFDEKGTGAGPGLINAGIYLIGSDLVGAIASDTTISLERDVFPTWIGHGLYGFETAAQFLDIGTPESYASAAAFFAGLTQR
jgi:NDP-sugar pyrophosphorylase family protein